MYRVACGLREKNGWEIAPSEFWQMSPEEWWWLYDSNIGREIAAREETMERLKHLYRLSNKGK